MKHREHAHMWAGDVGSKFLARLFVSLCVIVESSGNTPGTNVIANDLFQLVWSFRDAEVAEVRASVLCGVATSLACLGSDAVVSLVTSGQADGLPQFLIETARGDPDKDCRELATEVSQTVTKAIRAISM
jgi:hypothetical protein